ncbi:peroxiredoxin 1 [Rozella allomycis CSF55]|uniref:thioredoxin-dependent peroxiredoxin n=1 Tax=Rozella allomycis (strain CSF55) TaxID=988480 RepID=A0A075B1R0_ROZAC|nr:Thioredoxin-like fold domain-containing protein [Rozella allomycis CSF55]RKP20911.1 peroxiredoxin 1 [Rozella allomycis CSF55]|eukprot:EPZ34906.1 Thioredoxin-like fold domain-containing protein [Rozella allomycis CSF55]
MTVETNNHVPCLIQRPAPTWSLQAVHNGEIKQIASSDYAGKDILLLFYPADFTFVCPTEIIAFSDRAAEFSELGCQVIAVSCDSAYSHLNWTMIPREKGGLGEMNIPILADFNKSLSKKFGVLLEDEGLPIRGLFIIDKKGILRHATLNDLPIGRSVDEALRTLKAIHFADEHGEVCPVNWTPGKKGMKPTLEGVKEYFNSKK